MKAQLSKSGELKVERAGTFQWQFCPWLIQGDGSQRGCGNSCPLFTEDPRGGKLHVYLTCAGAECPVYEIVSDERQAKEQVTP